MTYWLTKPFQKTPHKILTVIIDEHGNLEYLKTNSCDILLELGETVTRRASHVEPATIWPRVLFHILRTVVSDKSRVAAWTRTWTCEWRVNTAPVGGPVLRGHHVGRATSDTTVATWRDRQHAIDAEVRFLNEFLLTR